MAFRRHEPLARYPLTVVEFDEADKFVRTIDVRAYIIDTYGEVSFGEFYRFIREQGIYVRPLAARMTLREWLNRWEGKRLGTTGSLILRILYLQTNDALVFAVLPEKIEPPNT